MVLLINSNASFKMADTDSSSSDEEERARLKEATHGVLPTPVKDSVSLTNQKENKKNDFHAKKLSKMLEDMLVDHTHLYNVTWFLPGWNITTLK